MSFKVLVVPEDHTNNGAILKPLVSAVLADAGKPAAFVKVVDRPRLRGYDSAVSAIRSDLIDLYRWMDLRLFFPDADRANAATAQALERDLAGRGITLLCCIAQPEVEAYAAAAYSSEVPGGWAAARAHRHFKEQVFAPLLAAHGDPRRPNGGRDLMIERGLQNLARLYQLCPELQALRDRVSAHLATSGDAST